MKIVPTLCLVSSTGLLTHAFVLERAHRSPQASQSAKPMMGVVSHGSRQSAPWSLRMSEESEENVDTEARAEESSVEENAPAEGEAQEEVAEDPEVVAIKEEIAKLESTLKDKRRELAYVSDKADEYTKSGYARKVAEMENMRRARSVSEIIATCLLVYVMLCVSRKILTVMFAFW